MSLTDREKNILQEIHDWEDKLYHHEANDFQLMYDKYLERSFQMLPEKVTVQIFSSLDNWLFHLHALIQGTELQQNAKERILANGRLFDNSIQSIEDMRTLSIDQLQYIADQHSARHRLYSFVQGGISGTGETVLLGLDIPGIAVINLRAVQLIAMAYGSEINTPYEMMTALKVFHTSILPVRLQSQGWQELKEEIPYSDDRYFYEGNENLASVAWLEQLLNQILKGVAIILFRKKLIQGIPFVSMAVGAGVNYQLTKKVTDFAQKYYQMRYLIQKKEF